MRKPNFFIIGAPKCGTTALSEYLDTNKNIFMSDPKEPHFFSIDMRAYGCCETLDQYLKLFDKAKESEVIIGEASVMYLYSEDAIKNIYDFNPDAKLLIALRNTTDYIYSYHNQMLLNNDEVVEDFEEAWKLQSERENGNSIPTTCRIKKLLDYKSVGKLGDQVEKVFEVFPKDQVHIVLLDDIKQDTKTVYSNILNFLGLEYDGKDDFPIVNENKRYRFKYLHKFRNHPPQTLMKFVSFIKQVLGIQNVSLMKNVYEANLKSTKREPLSSEFKKELLSYFEDDIDKLSKLINKNLDEWKKF